MKNIYKRNKIYYYRCTIPKNLRFYFQDKKEYVKSLNVKNINNAKIITRYLNKKLNLIKEVFKMATHKEILELIEEFKKTNIENIISRNSHLTQKQLNDQIVKLLKENNIDLIKKEMEDAIIFLMKKDENIEDFGIDEKLGNEFEKQMYQIKINALNQIKNKKTNTNEIQKTTIEDEINKYIEQRDKKNDKREKDIVRELNFFSNYFKNKNIIFIQDLTNNNLIEYRKHMLETRKIATSTIINYITLIVGFIVRCNQVLKITNLSTKNFIPTKSIKEKQDTKKPFNKKEISLILDNIKNFGLTKTLKKKKKHYKDYELILKIAIFSGARQSEICQLRKEDIIFDEESQIWYFDFNINQNKHIKNFYSIRKVPIHSFILNDVLKFIKNKKENLFNVKDYDISQDFKEFKEELGFNEKKDFMSFRRTFQNELKQKEVLLTIIDELAGHEIKDSKTTNNYTNDYTLEIKKEKIELLNFELD
ncbi:tyrosine-type recombinase/integrase [Aliarcobacter butzleri]|uniref:tyrosine-type recombinase/integrase n=3 Tax=Aliarcobacter butzleri TaxID=28197 RepID=UPI00125F8C8B|nr:tyrosine-type recombinase/integrase [Aliarcobacter butzleri]